MPENHALTEQVAEHLTEDALAGLRGYPSIKAGQTLLARTVRESALNVKHARAFLAIFDDVCPTPREIKDAAFNIRDRFQTPGPSRESKWKSEGFEYDATYYDRISAEIANNLRPGQSPMFEVMWTAIKRHLRVANFSNTSWGQCWQAARELGFPLDARQREEADQWVSRRSSTPPPAPHTPLTWPELLEAERRQKAAKEGMDNFEGDGKVPN